MKPDMTLKLLLAGAGLALVLGAKARADGTMSVLHAFAPLAPKGAYPWSTLVQGGDGNFYGTTVTGGAFGGGTVFQVTSAGGLSAIYCFSNGIDGSYPHASLVLASDGGLYGTTAFGGSNGVGTVFKLTGSGQFTPLYSFQTNGIDGQRPEAALVEGTNGHLYGTTSYGGSNNLGTIYEIAPGGAVTLLHAFTNSTREGSDTTAPLILGADGNFYGIAAYGGLRGDGAVFRITPQGLCSNIHSFTYATDGSRPWGALVLGSDGNFYGTTYSGGAHGYGTVFMMTPDGVSTPLYSFSNGADGGSPYAALVQGPNGNFYGTSYGSSTLMAGTNSMGTIFEITPGGSLTTLYTFTNGPDGANPTAGLALGSNGNFYGVAEYGGVKAWGSPYVTYGRILGGNLGWGTLFSITPDGAFTSFGSFPSDSRGTSPGAGLVQAANGLLYGVTERGGTNNDGTVFQMSWDGTVTPLYSFTAGADGAVPIAALSQGSDGYLYGATCEAGLSNAGAIFRMTLGGTLTPLHTFTNGADGGSPMSSPIQAADGNLYGTTTTGGSRTGAGTVFRLTPTGVLTTLHVFTNGGDGGSPASGLAQGADGLFYGVAGQGGTNGYGTIYRISSAGVFNALYSFKGGADGASPAATLAVGLDGAFYGVCSRGGASNYGTAFRYPGSGAPTPIYAFTGNGDGASPSSPLVQGTDGLLYGTTQSGGDNSCGTVFQLATNGVLKTLHAFTPLESGPQAYSALMQATNGNFYLACEGMPQASGAGSILRLVVPPSLRTVSENGGSSVLTWTGETGQRYQVQHRGSLLGAWTNLGSPVAASGPLLRATNTLPAAAQGFFRLQVLP